MSEEERQFVCAWGRRGYRPLSFISLSHSDNQSESATKVYNSFKADVRGTC